jgi:hypothetical protein
MQSGGSRKDSKSDILPAKVADNGSQNRCR